VIWVVKKLGIALLAKRGVRLLTASGDDLKARPTSAQFYRSIL